MSASFLDALASELGTRAISTDDHDIERCSIDWSWPALYARHVGAAARADAVVFATSDADVASTLRLATEHGVPVVTRGGGSGVMGAAVPHHGGIVLDLSRMNRVLDIDEISMTATVEAGHNGRAFEDALTERGLSFPHYPASAEWASVGGYVAARGSGVLSSRHGKIEDQILALRVVTAAGSVIDTLPFARHAAGPELTQLFVGSEGTLGVITRVTVKLVPSPAIRRFAALSLPALEAGIAAMRGVLQSGIRPSVVRLYDADATRGSLARVIDEPLDGPALLLVFEGEQEVADAEAETTLRALRGHGATELDPALCESWWDQRYAFYHPPQAPKLPQMWATIDAVADYTHILGVYHELRQALEPFGEVGLTLKTHFSHWYAWGTMVYPRFIVPDISSHPDPPKLYAAIWDAGVDAILRAGGVMNDHHGVGSTLAPYVARQWGAAYRPLLAIKSALDPANVLNPGKLGFPLRAVTGPVPA